VVVRQLAEKGGSMKKLFCLLVFLVLMSGCLTVDINTRNGSKKYEPKKVVAAPLVASEEVR